MIVAITGHPVVDLKELAKTMAIKFGLSFEELDEKKLAKNEGLFYNAKEGIYNNFVFANKVEENSVKIFIKYSRDKLLYFLMQNKKLTFEEAVEELAKIEEEKEKYFQSFFGLSLKDYNNYDLIINADRLDNNGIIGVIERYVNKLKK